MRRLETGSLAAALGAVLLLVSLFLEWYQPDLTGWDAFEVWDLVLAAIAVAVIGAAAAELEWWRGPMPGVELAVAGSCAVVIVLAALINHPPAAVGRGVERGAWLGLGGAVLILLGGVMSRAGVSLSFSVEPRPRSGPPRGAEPVSPPPAGAGPGRPVGAAAPAAPGAPVPRPAPGAVAAPPASPAARRPAPAPAPSPSPVGTPGARRVAGGRRLFPGPGDPGAGGGAARPAPTGAADLPPAASRGPGARPATAGDPGATGAEPADPPTTSRRWRLGRRAPPGRGEETEVTRPLPRDTDIGPPPGR